MLIIALILGLLNPVIILGIFGASILFGVVISLSSIFMSEKELVMMNKKETMICSFMQSLKTLDIDNSLVCTECFLPLVHLEKVAHGVLKNVKDLNPKNVNLFHNLEVLYLVFLLCYNEIILDIKENISWLVIL
jgi:hypothetical protein